MKKYDAIIIGFGKGGKTLAADLGSRGWTVAVVERSKEMYGGTCINIGCIPTKTLMHLSKVAQYSRHSSNMPMRSTRQSRKKGRSRLLCVRRILRISTAKRR